MELNAVTRSRLLAALLSGLIAIIVNILVLAAAAHMNVATAHGGLLRLFVLALSKTATSWHLPAAWASINGPRVSSALFAMSFHVIVGLVMAAFYAIALEPNILFNPLGKGLLYALGVWIINAAIVLPAIGEGFAGIYDLTIVGIGWYAVAHTLFFILLSITFAGLMRLQLPEADS